MNEAMQAKIRKLLALAGSPHAGEARAARDMAEKLMKKYHISPGEMDAPGDIVEKVIRRFNRVRQWEDVLLGAVLDYTAVEAVYLPDGRGEQLILIGREDRVIQAENLYAYLYDRLMALGKDYRTVVKYMDSFRLGMAQGVAEKLSALQADPSGEPRSAYSKEAVPVEEDTAAREADRYIEETYGKIGRRENSESFDSNSLGLGRIVGSKIAIAEQVE